MKIGCILAEIRNKICWRCVKNTMQGAHVPLVMKLREGTFIMEGNLDICPTGGDISLNKVVTQMVKSRCLRNSSIDPPS